MNSLSAGERVTIMHLHLSVQSKGAKEKVVTRIMVSRCEVDLMKIRTEFKKQHKRSLYQTIAVST